MSISVYFFHRDFTFNHFNNDLKFRIQVVNFSSERYELRTTIIYMDVFKTKAVIFKNKKKYAILPILVFIDLGS